MFVFPISAGFFQQRRHQKIIETAPSMGLTEETRDAMLNDACRLLAADNYRAAGTVEFLVDKNGKHYFMEVNPRVQVRSALHVIFMFCFPLTLCIRICAGNN